MTEREKLQAIAKYLDDFVKDTDPKELLPNWFTKEELAEIKGGRNLALEILIKFRLEEFL